MSRKHLTKKVNNRPQLGLNEIAILADEYLGHAERHYSRPWGQPVIENGSRKTDASGQPVLVSSEYFSMVFAMNILVESHGDTLAADFGPRCLTEIRGKLIKENYTRTGINSTIGRIKKFFRWCCENELCRPSLHHELSCVGGLYRNQQGTIESKPVEPASMESIAAVLPFVSPTISAMIRVQYLCGMRPGEACIMRPCDIVRLDHQGQSAKIWVYYPQRHKTAWRGFSLFKAIPKAAQEILLPLLNVDSESYLFRPSDSAEWSLQQRVANRRPRKTPLYPCEARRVAEEKRLVKRRVKKRSAGEHYTTSSYHGGLAYGFDKLEKAGLTATRFTPKQLRHAILSDVSRILDQQSAQRFGGHENLKTTDIYTGLRLAELLDITRKLDGNEEFSKIAQKLNSQDRP